MFFSKVFLGFCLKVVFVFLLGGLAMDFKGFRFCFMQHLVSKVFSRFLGFSEGGSKGFVFCFDFKRNLKGFPGSFKGSFFPRVCSFSKKCF